MPLPWEPLRGPCRIKDVSCRALTVAQLCDLRVYLQRLCKARLLIDNSYFARVRKADGPISWSAMNLYQVTNQVIKPLLQHVDPSAGDRWYSWAEFVARAEQPAQIMISHAWSGRFRDFMAAIDALVVDRQLSVHTRIWVCTFANCQFGEDFGSALLGCPFIKALQRVHLTVLMVDRRADSLTRAWCGLELHYTIASGEKLEFDVYTPAGRVGSQRASSGPLVEAVKTWDIRRTEAAEASYRRQILNYVADPSLERQGLKLEDDGHLLLVAGRPQLADEEQCGCGGDEQPRLGGVPEYSYEAGLFQEFRYRFEQLNTHVRDAVMARLGPPPPEPPIVKLQLLERGVTLGQLRALARRVQASCETWSKFHESCVREEAMEELWQLQPGSVHISGARYNASDSIDASGAAAADVLQPHRPISPSQARPFATAGLIGEIPEGEGVPWAPEATGPRGGREELDLVKVAVEKARRAAEEEVHRAFDEVEADLFKAADAAQAEGTAVADRETEKAAQAAQQAAMAAGEEAKRGVGQLQKEAKRRLDGALDNARTSAEQAAAQVTADAKLAADQGVQQAVASAQRSVQGRMQTAQMQARAAASEEAQRGLEESKKAVEQEARKSLSEALRGASEEVERVFRERQAAARARVAEVSAEHEGGALEAARTALQRGAAVTETEAVAAVGKSLMKTRRTAKESLRREKDEALRSVHRAVQEAQEAAEREMALAFEEAVEAARKRLRASLEEARAAAAGRSQKLLDNCLQTATTKAEDAARKHLQEGGMAFEEDARKQVAREVEAVFAEARSSAKDVMDEVFDMAGEEAERHLAESAKGGRHAAHERLSAMLDEVEGLAAKELEQACNKALSAAKKAVDGIKAAAVAEVTELVRLAFAQAKAEVEEATNSALEKARKSVERQASGALNRSRSTAEKEVREMLETARRGAKLSWETITLQDVYECLISPMTREHGCSYVEAVAGKSQLPRFYLSTSWDELFSDFMAAVEWVSDGLGLADSEVFFLDLTSVDHHKVKASASVPRLEDGIFAQVLQQVQAVVSVLTGRTLVDRIWLLAPLELVVRCAKDLYLSTPSGSLACTRRFPAGTRVHGSFPVQLAWKLSQVRVERAEGANRDVCLRYIANDGDLRHACRRFDARLRRWVSGPLLRQAAADGDAATLRDLCETQGLCLGSDALRGAEGETPLHVAAAGGRVELLGQLLDAGADLGAEDVHGETPLHWAALAGQAGAVQCLLQAGADALCESAFGETPLEVAMQAPAGYLLTATAMATTQKLLKEAEEEAKHKKDGNNDEQDGSDDDDVLRPIKVPCVGGGFAAVQSLSGSRAGSRLSSSESEEWEEEDEADETAEPVTVGEAHAESLERGWTPAGGYRPRQECTTTP